MLDFILEILRTPAIILGLIALVGLAIQKKSGQQIFSGTIKTSLGMLMVSVGAGQIVGNILPFVTLFQEVFGLTGFATSSEATVAAIADHVEVIARTSSLILGLGFVMNIIIARLSPLKYIFLTGHMTWILSVAIAHGLYSAGLSEVLIVVVGTGLQGMLMVILPAIAQPLVRATTGNDNFGYAHLTTLGVVPAAYIGGLVGNKENDAEKINMPKSLEFFKDTAMSIFIVMLTFYLIVVIAAWAQGSETLTALAAGQNYLIFAILMSMGFTVGILILLQGVRMFLGEIVPAFKGISDRLVPNSKPALDVPVLFAFAPNSLMIGFITAVAGMIIAMGVSALVFESVPLVSVIGAFFTGGVAGIFGNAKGGLRGAIVSGFIYGFILIFGSALIGHLIDFSAYGAQTGHDCVDAMVVMGLMLHVWIGITIILLTFVILCVLEVMRNKKIQNVGNIEEKEVASD